MPASRSVARVMLALAVVVATAAPAMAQQTDPADSAWEWEGEIDDPVDGTGENPAPSPPPTEGVAQAVDIYPMYFPHLGGITTGYSDTWGACRGGPGCPRSHEGTDIMAPKMTPIIAVASGTVGWMHDDQGGRCCAMALNHDDGWASWYIHMNNDTPGTDDGQGWGFAPGIETGVHVDAGQLIGWVGDSGNAEGTSPHTHFELHMPGGVKTNPYPHLLEATILSSDPPEVTLRGCDFEADGYDDLVIGTPFEDRAGRTDDGAVIVVPGAKAGPDAEAATLWHQRSAGVKNRAETDDRFGTATGCGDFDGDGFDDLVIGVPGEDKGRRDTGALNVLYGASGGLVASGDNFWHQNKAGVPDENNRGDALGSAVAVADFDNDGYDDVAVGAPGEKVAGQPEAGMVLVFDGGPGGFGSRGVRRWTQATPDTVGIAEAGDSFGAALVAGDFNGDAYVDLAIAAPREDHVAIDAGFITVLYGSASGLQAASSQRLAQGIDGLGDVAANGERFGTSLGAGDINGDGRDELVIGVPGQTAQGQAGAGAVHVVFGSASGLKTVGDAVVAAGFGDVPDTGSGSALGAAVTVGDFDGDGYEDVAAGAPGAAGGAGTVIVMPGGFGTFDGDDAVAFTQDTRGVRDVAEPGDGFGTWLSVGTFDGGAFGWLVVGVPAEDLKTAADAGVLHTLEGSPDGLAAAKAGYWKQNRPGIPGKNEAGDGFGYLPSVGR